MTMIIKKKKNIQLSPKGEVNSGGYIPRREASRYLLHVTREFHSVKLICRNLYAIFLHVKKAYTANQNGV